MGFEISQADVRVSGHRLRVKWIRLKQAPPPGRPTLLFLHEGLGCIELWRDFPQALALATGCDALIYERLGHGWSDPLASAGRDFDYLYVEAWQFLPGLLAVCEVDRCVLIGHSDGGTIGLLYASRHPDQVAGMVTEAAHTFVDEVTVRGVRQAVRAYRHGDLKPRLARYHGQNLEPLFWRWADTWLDPEYADWSIEAYLGGVRCPVLAIQGQDDEYGSLGQVESIVGGVGGYSQALVLADCGHVPHHQARPAALEGMAGFVTARCLGV